MLDGVGHETCIRARTGPMRGSSWTMAWPEQKPPTAHRPPENLYPDAAASHLGGKGFLLCASTMSIPGSTSVKKVLEALRKYRPAHSAHHRLGGSGTDVDDSGALFHWQEMGPATWTSGADLHALGARLADRSGALDQMGSLTDQYLTKIPADRAALAPEPAWWNGRGLAAGPPCQTQIS